MRRNLALGFAAASLLVTLSQVAVAKDEVPTEPQGLPNIMIVRVPAVGDEARSDNQLPDGEAEVFPLKVAIPRLQDGTIDGPELKRIIIELLQTNQPVKINAGASTDITSLPPALQTRFKDAEAQSEEDGAEAAVAWRSYGPVRGYNAGVVAYGRSPYRGYYPGYATPHYGYYRNGNGYYYNYGVYRNTPSYHYYGYYRNY